MLHPFPPIYNENSRILILGSFPSVKSREENFFYGHPRNRFWKVIAAVFGQEIPTTVPEKKELILKNRLALWDSIASCEITGSSDASIRNVKANDLRLILEHAPIERICCNGKTAWMYYTRLIQPTILREAACLPSTSPANAQWTVDALISVWTDFLISDKSAEKPVGSSRL